MESLPKHHLLELPPNALNEIRKILNLEKPRRIYEAVDILELWLKKQDHILKKDFGREYLEKTLISSKGSVEKAKRQIDRLCTMKTLLPQFFLKTNVKEELMSIMNKAWLLPLPRVTEDYYRLLMLKIRNTTFTEKDFLEYYQYNMILCEYVKRHDYVNGFVAVYDFQETNILDLVTKMNPVELQQYMCLLIEGFGARLKGIHILTQSKAVELFVKMVKQFLNQKIASRMHVHKTLEDLYRVIPKDLLTVEYGGKIRSMDKLSVEWIDELSTNEHTDYMKMMNKACTDETLRKSDQFNAEYMGMPGSFRNLSVD